MTLLATFYCYVFVFTKNYEPNFINQGDYIEIGLIFVYLDYISLIFQKFATAMKAADCSCI